MTEKKKLEVHMQLSVFRSSERYQVVNIKTFYGLETPYLYAFGFTEKGEPVLNPHEDRFYEFNGSVSGHVWLSYPFNSGIEVNDKKVIGFDAVVVMCSNYGHGLGITKAEIEEKVKFLIANSIDKIYFYKQSSVYGMAKAYDFKDSWLISGKDAVLELDYWNKFLKSINSQWRILTPKTRLLLRKLEYEKLKAEEV
jgi:hypothetical protein